MYIRRQLRAEQPGFIAARARAHLQHRRFCNRPDPWAAARCALPGRHFLHLRGCSSSSSSRRHFTPYPDHPAAPLRPRQISLAQAGGSARRHRSARSRFGCVRASGFVNSGAVGYHFRQRNANGKLLKSPFDGFQLARKAIAVRYKSVSGILFAPYPYNSLDACQILQ